MSGLDFSIGIRDVGVAVLQELWNKVAYQTMGLVGETTDLLFEKDSFLEFSKSISELHVILSSLNPQKVEKALGLESTRAVLTALNQQLKKASKIIKDYKCGSRLRLLLKSHSILLQMENLAKDIAKTISTFQLINLDTALNLNNMTSQIISNLGSMEFRSAAATEKIASEIESSISENAMNRENAKKLLVKIAEAVGGRPSTSLVQNELALLKQEKEEMEAQKMQAEALQLSQLIEFLYSTEVVTRPVDEETTSAHHQLYPIGSFICQLCNKLMTDPVAIHCGHSFEREAILEHFSRGERNCPTCRQELSSFDLTPNLLLRNSIEEWNERDMDLKFQAALPRIKSSDQSQQDKALEDLTFFLERPRYVTKAAEEGLATKLVVILKDDRVNAGAALKCLYYLAKYNDDQKKAIVIAGGIRRIVKHICKNGNECHALAVLFELSEKESFAEKIGGTKDCIPLVVSLLNIDNPDVSQKASKVLQNLSSNIHFVVKMAEAGHFQPFVARFIDAAGETKTLMAAALVNMQLKENNIDDLREPQFIHNLIQMLGSSSPASKSACLKCIKKLVAHHKIVECLLEDAVTIPHLLGLISFNRFDPQYKQGAAEILAKLIGDSEQFERPKYQGLQELQSKHNVSLLLEFLTSVEDQTKIQFLHLLVELSSKSEIARELIRTDKDAMSQLFSSIYSNQPEVRRWTMKLIYCISEGHPEGVPLPTSPEKEAAITNLATILINSPDTEERTAAAGIISQLPRDDISIDEILQKSDALKAICGVLCSMDDDISGNMGSSDHSTSLLENALAALLRYTEPSKPELQRQLGKLELYPSLVRVLTWGSPVAKRRTATALAHLSLSTSRSFSETIMAQQTRPAMPFFLKHVSSMWCCSASSHNFSSCPVHGDACSPRDAFCLVKADAVRPLVISLSDTESGVAEAALIALDAMLIDHSTRSQSTAAIVDSQGVAAILHVLDKGSVSAKTKALDLFQKIMLHTKISVPVMQKFERILIQFLSDADLKKKAALTLRQMGIIPEQSSYF
ncbi:U-box domain-containing protein 44-like [Argentina anserina]|uniref:U-box domain-containing protein 44-like n=1 Tax=Argentina anserina TaxID=57926 RepID=UPI00217695A6|nr:U-box domain-containing protein 44-like [Potentilla anserina]XP_050373948.1 U-box domain-containing protein 44-like [Potentilla anserina]